MKKKILKVLKNPLFAMQVLNRRSVNISFGKKIFAHVTEYRSDSENGSYASAIESALRNQKSFDNFKRNYNYRDILEHVNQEHGNNYLDIVRKRNDGLLDKALHSVLQSDNLGNPIKYKFDGIDFPLSPTTLRYLKVSSDLKGLFGDNINEIAEIGCGYGGQTYVNDQLLNIKNATLFDLPFVNNLIERYLNSLLLEGAYKTTVLNQTLPKNYDLVISNYAFSELPSILQNSYINKVLSHSKRGYLTMNSGLGDKSSKGKLSLSELREKLPKFQVFEEDPLTSPFNYIIVWGHNQEFATSKMQLKTLDC